MKSNVAMSIHMNSKIMYKMSHWNQIKVHSKNYTVYSKIIPEKHGCIACPIIYKFCSNRKMYLAILLINYVGSYL